jgi:hypothetical protein
MKTKFNMSTRSSVIRFVNRIAADAFLGATCGGLYGFVFGGIGALAQHESHRLIAITGVFALCGAIAGIALGAYSAFANANETSAGSSSSASNVSAKDDRRGETQVAAVRQLTTTSYRQPQSSHVAV